MFSVDHLCFTIIEIENYYMLAAQWKGISVCFFPGSLIMCMWTAINPGCFSIIKSSVLALLNGKLMI